MLTIKTEYVAPRNPTEHLLAQFWGEILDIKDIGVHDNFFELGGHSLPGDPDVVAPPFALFTSNRPFERYLKRRPSRASPRG
jgi:hypothetical protein